MPQDETSSHNTGNDNVDVNSASDMKNLLSVSSSRATELAQNFASVTMRIQSTAKSNGISKPIRLTAVSKLKPATDILALHRPPTSQLHFGENYVQELLEKSRLLPRDIRWHMIGGLQSNKCAQLAREVPNLWAVESVDSEKKAQLLDKGRAEAKADDGSTVREPLRVFVQVNTSGESSKSGIEPRSTELVELCRAIRGDVFKHLRLQGLMTIGAIARSKETTAETENEDFVCLRDNRDWVAQELQIEPDELELSMGMSEDFEGAIVQGSDEVRVGSTIFGVRPPKKEAKVLESTEEDKK